MELETNQSPVEYQILLFQTLDHCSNSSCTESFDTEKSAKVLLLLAAEDAIHSKCAHYVLDKLPFAVDYLLLSECIDLLCVDEASFLKITFLLRSSDSSHDQESVWNHRAVFTTACASFPDLAQKHLLSYSENLDWNSLMIAITHIKVPDDIRPVRDLKEKILIWKLLPRAKRHQWRSERVPAKESVLPENFELYDFIVKSLSGCSR